MLKSSNLESIINAVEAEGQQPNSAADLQQVPVTLHNNNSFSADEAITQVNRNTFTPSNGIGKNNNEVYNIVRTTKTTDELPDSLATKQLATGLLQIFEPPLVKARGQLKELIGKQNKIYIDLSAEKFKLDNAETAKLHEMMNNVKIYREKLVKIKKQMQSIYQRSKVLKKRAIHVQACKHKELQRKLQKQQQEESLIAKKQQTQAATQSE
ncbi:PREDICTED: biogenesis of lysosome-related organelles complex 1 subunit 6 [Bactrocera latifrons]|uniref:Biogenesis of lysosome-related organelles complex 1 subunit 6 n=1 Tax=Bactrocera latifrons TaxID=174628 RepID=A0A0K8UNC7_BACLA|nr:PREDICTED: biogenesis of lysosome-related organelles complex 1 subunit 6 [Bactrocera latifrons]